MSRFDSAAYSAGYSPVGQVVFFCKFGSGSFIRHPGRYKLFHLEPHQKRFKVMHELKGSMFRKAIQRFQQRVEIGDICEDLELRFIFWIKAIAPVRASPALYP